MSAARRRGQTGQAGQAFPLLLGLGALLLAGAVLLAVLGRVQLAKAEAQTAADLAALSAGRALLADLSASVDGPAARRRWTARLTDEARRVAAPAGARVDRLQLVGASWPPVAVQITVSRPGPRGSRVPATARAGLAAPPGVIEAAGGAWARGGGYTGPLAHRDGRPMCPAVAAAFDLMDAAARADGVDLAVVSGFRSDAEQALLFARHPDPRWVARPGESRHRDATELDLSLAGGARAWLPGNATRFGFAQRYSWEPWHWGYLPGCGVPAGGRRAARIDAAPAMAGVPEWVPVAYRAPVAAAAAETGVPPALLAALLRSESGFDPRAVSPVGAQGIAQFMPATAAGVGLRDPFDPAQAIPAAARLLAGHIRSFGSVPLALAAYNAGPGAVRRYGGVPPYAETQGYVARIMAFAGGAGALIDAPGGGVVLLRAGGALV